MTFEEQFKLKTNPFRVTPATSEEEIVWAGFPEIKSRFEKRIKRSIKLANSSLILNWGEYGSGKTHAARYFNKTSILSSLCGDHSIPYSIVLTLPKGKDPVFSIFTNIVDKVNLIELRESIKDKDFDVNKVIDSYGDNIQIQSVLKAIFNKDVDPNELKKFLYGNISNTELKKLSTFGILRKFSGDSDYTKFISGLFTCLSFDKKLHSSVILWIDEFEDIAVLSNSNIDKTNNFLREIMDNTPNNLLVFINLTQSALIGVEDLGEFLYESVRSRIKERNNFDLPSAEAFENYLIDLLSEYRTEKTESPYFPFEKEVVLELIKDLENSSLRTFNDAFSILLELADMDEVSPINQKFLNENKAEIIWEKI